MENQASRLKVLKEGDVTVVELMDKKILDEANISQIGETLTGLVAETAGLRLVLDFASVGHMSSSALSMLITLNKRIAERSGRLVLCNIHSAIYEAFRITRLSEVFRIYPSRDEAVSAAAS